MLVGLQGEDAHEVAEPRALGLHVAARVDGAPQVLAALRGGAHEAASPPPVAPPSSADLADAFPPQEPQEREGVPWDEVPVAAAPCVGDPVVLEALRRQGVWPLPWTLLLPSLLSGSVGGVPARRPPGL